MFSEAEGFRLKFENGSLNYSGFVFRNFSETKRNSSEMENPFDCDEFVFYLALAGIPVLVPVAMAARILGVAPRTVYQWISNEVLTRVTPPSTRRAIKDFRGVRIDLREILQKIEEWTPRPENEERRGLGHYSFAPTKARMSSSRSRRTAKISSDPRTQRTCSRPSGSEENVSMNWIRSRYGRPK